MIIVFTGNGKGKTTAALGQAMRALGQNKKVAVIQFIKGPWKSGEEAFGKKFKIPASKFRITKTGKGFVKILGDTIPFPEHKKAAKAGLIEAEKIIDSKKYGLVILDEINNAVNLKLIGQKEVLLILKRASKDTDIILTGRNAAEKFIQIADIVTEMKEVKHIFATDKSSAKKGLEY